jgi:diguanylate cyclase (GGDEF)-like protein
MIECKFLESYAAELDGAAVEVWHCLKRDPFVLGGSKEVAMATCASCRLGDFTRPPAELAVEVERRNQELVALNSIVNAVNASFDLDTVLRMALERLLEVLTVSAGWISFLRGDRFVSSAQQGLSQTFAADAAAGSADRFAAFIAERQETVLVEDVLAPPLALPDLRREGLRTLLGVPLRSQGRLLAVLTVATREPRAYSADDIYFASATGSHLAAALERALLFRRQEALIERERRLLEASETLNRRLDSHALSLTILAEAVALMGADKGALLVRRGDTLVAEDVYRMSEAYRRAFLVPVEDSVSGRALLEGTTIAVSDVEQEALVDEYLAGEGGFRAFMTAPLQSYRGASGAISVYYDEPRTFEEDDKTLLRTFAVQAAVALDNRRLMHEKDELAVRDGLTGVFNRSYLELTLERTIKGSRRSDAEASILFLDVDDLKATNDGLGHAAGDALLRDMAEVLLAASRDTDVVARYGGDEFVVLMPGTGRAGAARVTEKIDAAMEVRNTEKAFEPRLSASIGIHTASGVGVEQLLQEADRRMYAMKRARRGA